VIEVRIGLDRPGGCGYGAATPGQCQPLEGWAAAWVNSAPRRRCFCAPSPSLSIQAFQSSRRAQCQAGVTVRTGVKAGGFYALNHRQAVRTRVKGGIIQPGNHAQAILLA